MKDWGKPPQSSIGLRIEFVTLGCWLFFLLSCGFGHSFEGHLHRPDQSLFDIIPGFCSSFSLQLSHRIVKSEASIPGNRSRISANASSSDQPFGNTRLHLSHRKASGSSKSLNIAYFGFSLSTLPPLRFAWQYAVHLLSFKRDTAAIGSHHNSKEHWIDPKPLQHGIGRRYCFWHQKIQDVNDDTD